jgi:hypothetical protein
MHVDPLLESSLHCLMQHCHPEWGDRDGLDVFNRLLAKNAKPKGWTKNTHLTFQRRDIRSRREQWATETLEKFARGHSDPSGIDIPCPIIIAEYDGVQRVLDGNHRINRWVAARDKRIHEIHIHTVIGVPHLVVLPPIEAGSS